jgi:esterase/lipase superfamily enzyme
MSIYIISNRPIVKDDKGKEVFSNDGKEAALPNFRIAECQISNKTLSYELKKDLADPDYEKVIQVVKGELSKGLLSGTEYMFYDLYTTMKSGGNVKSDVMFFIHGYQTTHEDEKQHIIKLNDLYVGGKSSVKHLIYLSWPTSNSKILTYWGDKEDAIVTGQALTRIYLKMNKFFYTMFKTYEQENCKQKIHIMAHSMGNQVLKQMMGCLNEKYIIPFIGEIILLHADVSANSFEISEPFTKLHKLGQRTHAYIHRGDDALTISTTTKNLSKRLGKAGPSNIKELSQSTFIVDVTGIVYDKTSKDSFFKRIMQNVVDHWGYLTSSQEIDDIVKTLNGEDERRITDRKRHEIYNNYFYLSATDLIKTVQ